MVCGTTGCNPSAMPGSPAGRGISTAGAARPTAPQPGICSPIPTERERQGYNRRVIVKPSFPRTAVGLCVLTVVGGGCARSRAENVAARQSIPSITVAPVQNEEVRRTIEIVGTLVAWDETTVSAEAEGKGDRVLADLG